MVEKTITINLKHGLHARPSSYIVNKMLPLKLDKATMSYKGQTADMRSILGLLTLFAVPGAEVTVNLSGLDENQALKVIENVLNEANYEEIYNK